MKMQTVEIPACDQHEGVYRARVLLYWVCPICGGPRGKITPVVSYDGSLRMVVDGWSNPCGHVDKYSAVRHEAQINNLNNKTLDASIVIVSHQ